MNPNLEKWNNEKFLNPLKQTSRSNSTPLNLSTSFQAAAQPRFRARRSPRKCFAFSHAGSPSILNPIRGFTIIEFASIIVIIAIISAFAYTRWPGKGIELNAQAMQLAGDIRYIQELAMTQNQRYRINFASGQYSFTTLNGLTGIPHPATNNSIIVLQSGVALSTSGLPNGYLAFSSRGVPYINNTIPGTALSSNATITLTADSSIKAITITPETGHVTVS